MNKFAILLTCCINPLNTSKVEIKKRESLYLKVINKWLDETSFEIFCVDSSNYQFKKINNTKFHYCSFLYENKKGNLGKTIGEIKSIKYVYKKFHFLLKKYVYLIKITGKYYLENLEEWTKKPYLKSEIDLYLQRNRNDIPFYIYLSYYITGYEINSEIFICRISKLKEIFFDIKINTIMEKYLYLIVNSGKFNCDRLPKLKNSLNSRRGDNKIIKYL